MTLLLEQSGWKWGKKKLSQADHVAPLTARKIEDQNSQPTNSNTKYFPCKIVRNEKLKSSPLANTMTAHPFPDLKS